MNHRTRSSSQAQQSRTTVFYAVGTFVAFSLVAIVGWSLTRSGSAPVSAIPAAPVAQSAAPAVAPPHEHNFERIGLEEFKKALDAGEITVIDVRDMDSFVAAHIPGSLHIPLTRIEGEIPYLPKGKPIVTYCSCPAEESSGESAMILANGGIAAKALHGGFGAWVAAGFPTEAGVK